MKVKKILSVIAASCFMASICVMPINAHHGGCGGGHHGTTWSQSSTQITYTTCNVEGCNITYNHIHDGQYCYGHFLNDGHNHTVCTVDGCTQTGLHSHDENWYFCGSNEVCMVDGCTQTGLHYHDNVYYYGSCHDSCTVDGCTQTGLHYHNNNYYFGHNGSGCYSGGCWH